MHSENLIKDPIQFSAEINAILVGTSRFTRSNDIFDFTGFVFPEAQFSQKTLLKPAIFSRAKFNCNAQFESAFLFQADFTSVVFRFEAVFLRTTFRETARFFDSEFVGNCIFASARFFAPVEFGSARFRKIAQFQATKFLGVASFSGALFSDAVDFSGMTCGVPSQPELMEPVGPQPIVADFSLAQFLKPEDVKFRQANQTASDGVRFRFRNCDIERIPFEDVRWHRNDGRIVIQDEIDVGEQNQDQALTRELVAGIYRKLINNFERNRQHDLAEDCFCGVMEMRRRDHNHFFLSRIRRIRNIYRRWRIASWFGRNFSLVSLYRLLSFYGSSYIRAFIWIGLFSLLFSFGYPFFGIRPGGTPVADTVTSSGDTFYWPNETNRNFREYVKSFAAGFWVTLDVATFTRNPSFVPASKGGKHLAIVEVVVVPGQVALFLLALRRRFQR